MKRTAKYQPPPLRPPPPETVPEPPGPWQAAERDFMDMVDGFDRLIATTDGWGPLMTLVVTGALRAGKYRIIDGTGRRVAELVVDMPGSWRVYSAGPRGR